MVNLRHPRANYERPDGSITQHELGIRTLLQSDPRIFRYHFPEAVRAIVRKYDCEENCLVHGLFAPDAYRIDWEGQWIDMFEVEVRNPLSGPKLALLREWWLNWDDEGQCDFLPRLFILHRYGTTEIDLSPQYA